MTQEIASRHEQELEKRREIDALTMHAMGSLFCKKMHPGAQRNERGMCQRCDEIIAYSLQRTAACPHEHQGNCQDCPIRCYKPDMRAGVREIMRYSAPRMIYRHPYLTAIYLRKKIAGKRAAKKSSSNAD